MKPPIPDCYWIVPGKLLAGEYPGAKHETDAIPRLAAFATAGVTSFIDVTQADEGLTPYGHLLPAGARWERYPIRDGGCPAPAEMLIILDRIDDELARGRTVYVHCWGGHGRTGTVTGCWLVRHGARPADALSRISELRRHVPDALWMPSPEPREQTQLVHEWIRHDPDAALAHALAAAAPAVDARAASGGVAALGETKDLQPELVHALRESFDKLVWPNAKTPIPSWTHVGHVDVAVRATDVPDALLLGAELKWGKLDEGVWDIFKMALLAARPDVAATYLVTGADAKTWAQPFCTSLFTNCRHSSADLCTWRYPVGSKMLVWDWMLAGGHDHYPDFVPHQIETRLVATQAIAADAAEIRAERVLPSSATIPFIGGWPNGNRPADAKHPLPA